MPTVLNAANEVAVEEFLAGRISFTAISALVNDVLQREPAGDDTSLDEIMAADEVARAIARESVADFVDRRTQFR